MTITLPLPDTRRLVWCTEHDEPAWLYSDGSWSCWHEDVVGRILHEGDDTGKLSELTAMVQTL